MFIVVSYDVADDRRRLQVMKALEDYGHRVQYSVFECDVKPEAYRGLRDRLNKLISAREDKVRFYFLDEDAVGRIDSIGMRVPERARPYYIIGQEAGGPAPP